MSSNVRPYETTMDIKTLINETWDSISVAVDELSEAVEYWMFREDQTEIKADTPHAHDEFIDWDDPVEAENVMRSIDFNSHARNYIETHLSDLVREQEELISSYQYDLTRLSECVSSCKLAASQCNSELLKEGLHTAEELNEEYKLSLDELLGDLSDLTSTLAVNYGRLIYIPKKPEIIILELVVPINQDLVQKIRKQPSILYSISPRDFEELIAELFERRGFKVQLTKQTRDGGKDIIAFHEMMGITSKYIIECKKYAKHRKVTLELVQRLFGVKLSEGANKAILVTTSSYTKDAISFGRNHIWDLALKDYRDIMSWIGSGWV